MDGLVTVHPEDRSIRVIPEYHIDSPLWGSENMGYIIEPTALPISDDLSDRIYAWVARFIHTYDPKTPQDSRFASKTEAEQFVEDGRIFFAELQRALGDAWIVTYDSNSMIAFEKYE